MRNPLFLLLLIFFAACEGDPPAKKIAVRDTVQQFNDSAHDTIPRNLHLAPPPDTLAAPVYSPVEQQLLDSGLVDIATLDSSIIVELRYSTENNFLGMDVYGDLTKAFLQPDVAQKLLTAQRALKEKYPYYTLVVYDAVRPLHIQQLMWDTLDLPPGERQKYLSNPAKGGSLHNYGAAVDVSIVDENGIPLDMGTPYDFFGVKAHPVQEAALLESGELTIRQVRNREILRSVMRQGGFFGIQTEWWHFNSCTREAAVQRYSIVQ